MLGSILDITRKFQKGPEFIKIMGKGLPASQIERTCIEVSAALVKMHLEDAKSSMSEEIEEHYSFVEVPLGHADKVHETVGKEAIRNREL